MTTEFVCVYPENLVLIADGIHGFSFVPYPEGLVIASIKEGGLKLTIAEIDKHDAIQLAKAILNHYNTQP